MSARYFLDTNIFVYVFQQGAHPKSKRAEELVRDAVISSRGVISYQVAQEFVQVALRFTQPLSIQDIEAYLGSVLHPLTAVHSSTLLLVEALALHKRYRFAWYDALIVAAAMAADCEVLYSEDLQHGLRIGKLEIRNPFVSLP
jgi:predicted nucleic acid-binding protein